MEAKTIDFDKLKYLPGFGNHHATESLPGALPLGQNTPQRCPYDLYAEQLTGSAFTQSRPTNFRTWFYRIRPSVTHQPFKPCPAEEFPNYSNNFGSEEDFEINPNQLRWKPLPLNNSDEKVDFIQGILTVAGIGCPSNKDGICMYQYSCNTSMGTKVFSNSDGEMLIVPQTGTLHIRTECGNLSVPQKYIAVIPRGLRFSVDVTEASRGWICEVFNGRYKIPDLGPIGANGLANPRDFEAPEAAYVDLDQPHKVYNKFQGKFFVSEIDHSPYDVVAWHGNFYPYRYNLDLFNTMNTVSFDHPDPSIFTVLTCPSVEAG